MKRVFVTASLAALAVALMAAPASAAKKSLRVSLNFITFADCSVAPDKVRMAVAFEATVKAKKVKKPSKITVAYKLTDPATGVIKVEETRTLKPDDYFNVGTFLGYTVGSKWTFDGTFSYKSTVTGKRISSTTSQPITAYTNEELAALGVPSCV